MSSAAKIKLDSFDDLFGFTGSEPEETKVNIEDLIEFKNHPFYVKEDEELDKLVNSIKENGVLNPLLVRRMGNKYEVISGNRRTVASKLAGLREVPVKVMDITDDEATIIMVDSNIYRENILPSEKAFAYRMKNDALKHQGKKSEMTAAGEIAETDSERQVFRYIRLTYLIKDLLNLVDEGKLKFLAAVNISYISEAGQSEIMSYYEMTGKLPSNPEAEELKNIQTELDFNVIQKIYTSKETTASKRKVSIGENKLNKFFDDSYSADDIENLIIELLEKWKSDK